MDWTIILIGGATGLLWHISRQLDAIIKLLQSRNSN